MNNRFLKYIIIILLTLLFLTNFFINFSKEKNNATLSNKKTIIYAGTRIDEPIRQAILEFNKKDNEYVIKIKDYSNEKNPDLKLTNDILSGNSPDIIDLSWIPLDILVSKNILEDLTPYIKNDQELQVDDFIPSVWNAMEIKGKHYYLAPGFNINTLICKSKDLQTTDGWSYDDLTKTIKNKPTSTQLLSKKSKEDTLYSLLKVGINDFINLEEKTCNFNQQKFKDLLSICNTYGKYNDGTSNNTKLFKEDKQLLFESDCSLNIDEYLIMDMLFGQSISYVGYPSKDKQGSYFTLYNRIGMYSNTKEKKGVWRFIRRFMTKEYQATTMYNIYTPTRQDCLDLSIDAAMTTKPYTNEFGKEIIPRFETGEYDNYSYTETPMTKRQASLFRSLINNTRKCEQNNDIILQIIKEESIYYFEGKKTLDETTDIIQNRITTYINEIQ